MPRMYELSLKFLDLSLENDLHLFSMVTELQQIKVQVENTSEPETKGHITIKWVTIYHSLWLTIFIYDNDTMCFIDLRLDLVV